MFLVFIQIQTGINGSEFSFGWHIFLPLPINWLHAICCVIFTRMNLCAGKSSLFGPSSSLSELKQNLSEFKRFCSE